MDSKKRIQDEIDNYKDTIYAIVGFMNIFRYDDENKCMRDNVKVFQGRKLYKNDITSFDRNKSYVTPDLGILFTKTQDGILGEVKKTFPKNEVFWMDDFKQLMSYDTDLSGWPNEKGKVKSHDIVLIVHQTRGYIISQFFKQKNENRQITFSRPFCIVEFNRVDQRAPSIFLRTMIGNVSESRIDNRLKNGISIPMLAFIQHYSTFKLYDSEPPIPYLLELIWSNVVGLKAAEDPKFRSMRWNQKINITIEVDVIVHELYEGFSFKNLHGDNNENQPIFPRREWIQRACEILVKNKEADWVDIPKLNIKFYFKKHPNVLEHFIEICSKEIENEDLGLFPEVK
jgi:hypothetical protein